MNKLKIIEILRDMRKVLESPSYWTKNTYARTELYDVCSVRSRLARSFCLLGAQQRVTLDTGYLTGGSYKVTLALMHTLAATSEFQTIPDFNDAPETTHEDVLALIDLTITYLETQSTPSNV